MITSTMWWLIPVIAAGLALIVAMFKYPKLWLGTFFFVLPIFLSDTGKGLTASELAVGGFLMVSVVVWMAWMVGTHHVILVRWWGDFLLLLFLALSFGNCVIAVLNGVPFVNWLAEWSIYLLVLYYFPIRHYFDTDERSIRQLLIIGAISTVLMAAYSIYLYKVRMAANGALYAYQLWSSRSVLLGPMFVMTMLIGIPAIYMLPTRRGKALAFVLVLINAGALALTFTRSLWIFFFVSLLVVAAYLRPLQNLRLGLSIVGIIAITYYAATLYNPRLTAIAVRIVKERIASSTQLSGGDYSFETRTIEATDASKAIARYPLGGNGIRTALVSWGPIEQIHWRKSFIHIGYISLPFKLGIPMALLMLWTLGLFAWRAVRNGLWEWKHRTLPPFTRSLLIGLVATYPTLAVVIFFTGFFDQRWGMVMLAFILAATSITNSQVMQARRHSTQQLS